MSRYVTIAELKDVFHLPDTIDDPALEAALAAAEEAVDRYCERVFSGDAEPSARAFCASATATLNIDDFFDADTVEVATDLDADGEYETEWAEDDFLLAPVNAAARSKPFQQIIAVGGKRFPTIGPRPRVRVTARWGWPAVPAEVPQAVRLQAARLFKRKDAPFGVAGSLDVGELRLLAELDADVRVLLGRLRLHGGLVA